MQPMVRCEGEGSWRSGSTGMPFKLVAGTIYWRIDLVEEGWVYDVKLVGVDTDNWA